MPYTLKSRNVLVTGGSRGLGAAICEAFAQEGSNVAINYNASGERAKEVAAAVEKHGVKAALIQADMSTQDDCKRSVKEAIQALGGLDIVIHNAGFTQFETFGDLDAMDEDTWDKCWAVNTKAISYLFRAAKPTLNENPDGGCFLITSSIAGLGPQTSSSMAYSVTKAAGLQLMMALATTQGPKIRVNAGTGYPEEAIESIKQASALKKETPLGDCADAFVALAKNPCVTGETFRVGYLITGR